MSVCLPQSLLMKVGTSICPVGTLMFYSSLLDLPSIEISALFSDFLNHFLFLWFPPKMSVWTDGRMDRMDQSNRYLWLFLSKSTIDHVLLLNNNEGDQHRSHDLDNVDSNAILSTDRSLFLLLFNFMVFFPEIYIRLYWMDNFERRRFISVTYDSLHFQFHADLCALNCHY